MNPHEDTFEKALPSLSSTLVTFQSVKPKNILIMRELTGKHFFALRVVHIGKLLESH